jgi:hypothetical protein
MIIKKARSPDQALKFNFLIRRCGGTLFSTAIRTNREFGKWNTSYFAYIFQLIFGSEVAAANGAGFHLKGASPDRSFIFRRLHFNMPCRTNKSAGAATDANGRVLIVGRADHLVVATAG